MTATTEAERAVEHAARDGAGLQAVTRVPALGTLLGRALLLALLAAGVFLVDRISTLLMDYWLLESLGFAGVFWTNFWTSLLLFACAFALFVAAVAAPALLARDADRALRRRWLQAGVLVGLAAGYLLSQRFHEYLLLVYGKPFGQEDPVFGKDAGFYVFDLPPTGRRPPSSCSPVARSSSRRSCTGSCGGAPAGTAWCRP